MNTMAKTIIAATCLLAAPTMAAAQACPSWTVSGAPLSYTSDVVYTPQRHSVIAGGDLNLTNCDSVPGVGHIISSPDFTVQYDAQNRGRALEFRIEASCDSVLLVNDAIADWRFNDDDLDNGTENSRLRIANAPSGQYDVWVGTFGASTCDATLIIESW